MKQIHERCYTRRTVGEVLDSVVQERSTAPFLVFQEQQYSYLEFADCVRRFAGGFRKIGVEKGAAVCLLIPNCPEWIFMSYGLAYIGGVEVGINSEYRGTSLATLINLVRSRVLVLDERFADLVAEIVDELEFVETVVFRGSSPVPQALKRFSVLTLDTLGSAAPVERDGSIQPGDPWKYIFTSGTTGPAKAVVVSHNFALDFSTEWVRNLRYTQDDVLYTCFPLFHAGAALETVLAGVVLGARVGLGERFSASGFWDDIRRTGATVFTALGAVLTFLWKQPERPDDRDHAVRQILVAPRAAFTEEFEERFGVRAVDCYGTTEVGHPVFDPIDGEHRDGYVGRLVGHHTVMIADDEDRPVPPGQRGQILVRPNGPLEMMSGYFANAPATVQAWSNLWYHTGDLGSLSSDGWLAFHGRLGDRLRVRGHQVSAQEIEPVLEKHPAVLECAVVAAPGAVGGEDDIKAVLVARPGSALTAEAVFEFAQQHLARYMVPRYYEFVDALEKNPSQKVKKSILRDRWNTANTVDLGGRLRSGAVHGSQE